MSSRADAPVLERGAFLEKLLAAPRAGAERILAFFDSRAGAICRDGSLLMIPLDDHMCHRGDGLFESVNYRERRIFALDAHLERLFRGAEELGLKAPYGESETKELIRDVAYAGGAPAGDIRIFLSRGPGGFGVSTNECPATSLYIVALDARPPDPSLYKRGLTAFVSKYPPKQDYLAQIKSVNYLPNVLMASEAKERGMDVAVTFDENGYMGEAAIANIALIDKDGCLRAPEIKRILPGTTMLAALKLAEEKIPVRQGPIHISEIAEAREMLALTSASLCVGVTRFNDVPVGQGASAGTPGPVALWLKDALLESMLKSGTPF